MIIALRLIIWLLVIATVHEKVIKDKLKTLQSGNTQKEGGGR